MTTDNNIALLEAPVPVIKLNNDSQQSHSVLINAVEAHHGDVYKVFVKGSFDVIGTATGDGTVGRVFVPLKRQALLEYAGREIDIYYELVDGDTGNELPSKTTRVLISLG
ncbi:hypothetical protein [Pseudomonas fluorescens]|jgi:hypothetical protein|uniref:hypothetical protein n=1 Tax=Pseudomonas fluorescens TaxID=294 RepID=UPI003D08E8FE